MNIYINDLSKYYKNKKALDHITLHLSSGIYGLIGPNGAGKTTFLSILCGLIKNDSGTVEIDEVKFLSDDFIMSLDMFLNLLLYMLILLVMNFLNIFVHLNQLIKTK